jgi:hypothetical protein
LANTFAQKSSKLEITKTAYQIALKQLV